MLANQTYMLVVVSHGFGRVGRCNKEICQPYSTSRLKCTFKFRRPLLSASEQCTRQYSHREVHTCMCAWIHRCMGSVPHLPSIPAMSIGAPEQLYNLLLLTSRNFSLHLVVLIWKHWCCPQLQFQACQASATPTHRKHTATVRFLHVSAPCETVSRFK